MEFVLAIFGGVIATLITIFNISILSISSDITADAVLSSIATISTGVIALIAALQSIKNMNKNHKEQIDKILEKNDIEKFFRYKKDFEYNYRSIIENHKKNESKNYKISASNIFAQLHKINNFKGIPTLDDKFINQLIELISIESDLLEKILKNRDRNPDDIMCTASDIHQKINKTAGYLYTTDKITRINTNQKTALSLKEHEIAQIISLHFKIVSESISINEDYMAQNLLIAKNLEILGKKIANLILFEEDSIVIDAAEKLTTENTQED